MNEQNFTAATVEQIKILKGNPNHAHDNYYHAHWRGSGGPYLCINETTPWGKVVDDFRSKIGLPAEVKAYWCYHTPHPAGKYYQHKYDYTTHQQIKENTKEYQEMFNNPSFLLLNYDGNEAAKIKPNLENIKDFAEAIDAVYYIGKSTDAYYYSRSGNLGGSSVILSCTWEGQKFLTAMPMNIAEKFFGLKVVEGMKLELPNGVSGVMRGWEDCLTDLNAYRHGSWRDKIQSFDFTFDTLNAVATNTGFNKSNMKQFLKNLDGSSYNVTDPKMSGIAKTWKKLEPMMAELKQENPIVYCDVRTLAATSNKSIDGVKVSVIFNSLFEDVTNKTELVKKLKDFHVEKSDEDYSNSSYRLEESVKRLAIYKEKRKAVIKSQGNRALTKIMEEVDSLNIDQAKYKLTWAKIESGELPIGTFFRKSEQYHLLNDNWDLWEGMFKAGFGEQAIELANEVKGRTTYEKDLMSYFYFVLHALPDYLKKHTGKKWKCIPKLVNSSEELDPPTEEGGVARKRSALTPTADNEANTVLVPYASLAIYGGRGTTYCYSHDYHVLTNGYSLNGYAITNELEKKLNGRDDYGLMFYTLTGSAQGRGYPTFLIIFERRSQKGDVKVHFHRTHPSRSKDGDYAPIHNWVRLCYNWMAGNIKQNRIKAQQGDLAFVQVKTEVSGEDLDGTTVKNLDFGHEVNSYDNHRFETGVKFAEYTNKAKSNILGYVDIQKPTWLRHNEHDDVLIPTGTYAIHQCRSWEANPKGVWSLRID